MDLATQLAEARTNLERIRNEYKDDPDLLAVYEPSALWLVQQLESIEGDG